MKRDLFFLMILIMLLMLIQCTKKSPTSVDQEDPLGTTGYAKGLVESDNKFGIKLFQEIVQEEGDTNIFISPLSVSMALGMTYNGADGATKEAMEKTLELSGLTVEEINKSYRNLTNLLTQLDPKVQFDIANSIWYRENLTPEQKFLDLCSEYFYAQVTGMDFSKSDAADIINAWVDENTNGKIKDIVGKPIDPYTVMFLINAIYFKGTWTYQFDPDETEDDLFWLPNWTNIPCKMMQQRGFFKYYAGNDFQAVDLPYGDSAFSMTIFLPYSIVDIDAFIARLDPDTLNYWFSCFASDSGDIYLPRFKLEYELKLNDVLTSLGMGIAFTPAADFSKMYKDVSAWIDLVRHKTFVEVNEEGTEAAAVTVVSMSTGISEPRGFVLRVDRPFLFVIRENQSGTILFIGQIMNPGSE
jgi:serine protease inhibitor